MDTAPGFIALLICFDWLSIPFELERLTVIRL